ncbi:hypothetical protein ACFOQM_03755 [Paenibacillus sp. GCM10012307]|uniref:YqbQ/XkdQ domain-containing protein n=1 Tax=Paenibacillus roseus TaxID=2798579 RepID=A0A934MJY4_9BACL|nr:hypothetical protein [Paenibacillus roseus]MBJ6360430.1 hypothetical protein [Paenibacillus roseus]
MLEIIIDNRDGMMWDISGMVTSLKYTTGRVGKASSAELSFVKTSPYTSRDFKCAPGNIIRIKIKGQNLFYGYIFSLDEDEKESLSVMAYDQMRYLMGDDTYVFTNVTATQIIRKIAEDNNLKLGQLANTQHVIPKMLEEGKKLMDIICKALDSTLMANKGLYVFYDDFGKLTLRNLQDMKLDVVLGEKSLLYSFSGKRSIDNETYNQIKLVRDNKDTGKREVYMARDSATIAKWGTLQYYEKVDDGQNEAQINQTLNNLIELKNREQVSLTVTALGDARVRAGNTILLIIKELGIQGYYVVNDCTHQFDGDAHTMSLELVVYGS